MFYRLLTTVVICIICKFAQHGSSSVALLEIVGSKGAVQVNGKSYGKKSRLILSGGDEVVFGSSGKEAYVSFRYGSMGRIYLFFFRFFLLLSSFFTCLWSPLQKTSK